MKALIMLLVQIFLSLRGRGLIMKVKDKYLDVKQQEFELDLSYQEWLRDNCIEPSQQMEEEFVKSSILREHTVTLKPLNNITYSPDRSIK